MKRISASVANLSSDADELGPSEAERAERVASLAGRGEHEACLVILVLHSGNGFIAVTRHVVVELSGWVRIEAVSNLAHLALDVLPVSGGNCLLHAQTLLEGEHPGLRERELEDWILGDRAPIDQLLNDIVVSPERKDVANHTDRLP